MPDSQRDAQVRAALERIQGWPEMMRSPQLAGFLGYIVERMLAGEAQSIKAYTIAVDVFGRSADFDAQSDPIVRVQARRLRSLLEEYYDGPGRDEPVRFALPVGRYVPEVMFAGEFQDAPDATPVTHSDASRPRSFLWWTGPLAFFAMLIIGIGLVALALILNAPSESEVRSAVSANAVQPPIVQIYEFQNLTGDPSQQPVVAGLALELVTDLELFGDVRARYGGAGHGDPTRGQARPDFDLTGIARLSERVVQYSTILTETATQTVVWSHVIERDAVEEPRPGTVDDLSRELALLLGNPRGPIHAALYGQIALGANLSGRESLYGCLMLFHSYRDTGSDEAATRAERCFAALPETVRQQPMALAATARLLADAAAAVGGEAEGLAAAGRLMEVAVREGAINSFVWEQQARLHEIAGRYEEARSAYGSALQLNPANADAMAALAMLLALHGEGTTARQLAETALTKTPAPVPNWYYGATAIISLRTSDFTQAADYAQTFARSNDLLGPVLAVVAAFNAGESDMVNRYLPQVLDDAEFRAQGILSRLDDRIGDRVLLADIRKGLIEAGVPSDALDGPY